MKSINAGVTNQEQCDKLNEEFKQFYMEITITPEDTIDNPAKRAIANMLFNHLYGKFGQKENQEQYTIINSVKGTTNL